MSIPYAELTDEVVGNLEIDSTDLSRYQVVEKINIAQWEIISILPFKWIANVIKSATFNLVADQHLYKYPNDFVRFVEAKIDFSAAIAKDNPGDPLNIWIPDNHHKPMRDIATSNYPFIDLEREGGFEIQPYPTSNMTSGGWIRYVWKIPAVSVTGPQPSLLNYNLKPLLVHRATELAALVDNYRPDLSAAHKKLFEENLSNFMPKREKS